MKRCTGRRIRSAGAPQSGVRFARLCCLLLCVLLLLPARTSLATARGAAGSPLPETGEAVITVSSEESAASAEPTADPNAGTPAPDAGADETTMENFITIDAPAMILCVGGRVDLMKDVRASDETGTAVEVAILDEGGLSMEVPGEYIVTYTALHPKTHAAFSETRSVTVLDKAAYAQYVNAENYERHIEFIKLRKQCYRALSAEKETLTALMRERIAAFIKENGLREDAVLRMRGPGTDAERIIHDYTIENWLDVVTVFLATRCYKINAPEKIFLMREEYSLGRMEETLTAMTVLSVEYSQDEDGLPSVCITCRTKQDVLENDDLNAKRKSRLKSMCKESYQTYIRAIAGDDDLVAVTGDRARRVVGSLPDGLSDLRRQVVTSACKLVGKVPYYVGGKYNHIGWNADWGVPTPDMSLESRTFGELVPYGLDCGGFVAWTFVNATRSEGLVTESLGSGSAKQWENSEEIAWIDARPGDLVFFAGPGDLEVNHVGVIVEADAGKLLTVHCSSDDGVTIEDAEKAGFEHVRRPYLYGEE